MNKKFTHFFPACSGNRIYKSIILLIFLCGFEGASLLAQTVRVFSSSGTFTVPACVTSITVQCWGAGGGGGGASEAGGGAAGQGGGGGGFATATLNNVSGSFTVTVGQGGPGGIGSGGSGPNGTPGGSSIVTNGTVTVTGVGGGGGAGSTGGVASSGGTGGGGTFVGVTGTFYKGGNGGEGDNQDDNTGGGGGGGAGNTGAGVAAQPPGEDNNSTGGAGGTGVNGMGYTGAGGAGGGVSADYWDNGDNGLPLGGGGGGGGGETSGGLFGHGTDPGSGGSGANGQVVITYSVSTPTITSVTGTGCPGTTITITGTLLGGATGVTIGSTPVTNISATETVVTGTIANGTTTGFVTVNTPCGSVTSASAFTVNATQAPVNLGTISLCGGNGYTFGGHTYTTAGTYYDTATSVTGCDSITTVTLMGGATIFQTINNTVCEGSSFLFGGQPRTNAGMYLDTATSEVTGCDSITTLNLTIIPYVNQFLAQSICPGGSFTFNGATLTAAGTYADTATSFLTGCDSITTLTLSLTTYAYNQMNQTICQGDSLTFNGITYYQSGTYADTLIGASAAGCDSISALILAVNAVAAVSITSTPARDTICSGDSIQLCATQGFSSYSWSSGGSTACFYASEPGNYTVTATEASGCTAQSDAVTITIPVGLAISISESGDTLDCITIAQSYQWYFNQQLLTGDTGSVFIAQNSGNYVVVMTDIFGCTYASNPIALVTGINSTENGAEVRVFPNPLASGKWQLVVSPGMLGATCEVFDASGQSVFRTELSNTHTEISPDLAKGIYVLQIRSAETNYTFKLIKLN